MVCCNIDVINGKIMILLFKVQSLAFLLGMSWSSSVGNKSTQHNPLQLQKLNLNRKEKNHANANAYRKQIL
jgi:hypothetical protein